MPDVPLSPLDFTCASSGDPEVKARFVEDAFLQFSRWGACILRNAPIPEPLTEQAAALRREAFLQSAVVKRAYAADNLSTSGYTDIGFERYGDMEIGQPRETLTMNWITASAKDGSKIAPKGNKFPAELPGAATVYDALAHSLDDLSRLFLRLMAERLDGPTDLFERSLDGGEMILRLLHYPPQNTEQTDTRIVAHKDATLLTMILDADRPGLQILAPDRQSWRPYRTGRNEVIVFAGETTEYLTNGAIRAAIHRVANDEDAMKSRYSTACFLSGNDVASLEPIETATTGPRPAQDETQRGPTALEFTTQRLSSFHLDDYSAYERLPVQTP